MRSWETWDTSVIDMRHGSIMPFQEGYLAMGQAPEYASFLLNPLFDNIFKNQHLHYYHK